MIGERMMRRYGIILVSLVLFGWVATVWAHASLLRTDPAPNSVVPEPPAEIRLWFTEPLERAFSTIRLYDANGNLVETPPSEVDPNDPYQMALRPGDLPDGLYTVVWQVLSSADGHPTQGSFPLTIGAAVAGSAAAGQGEGVVDTIPPDRSAIRWANLLSLSLAVGSIGFRLFVWNPAISKPRADIERRMDRLTWISWVLVGLTGVLLLFMQVSTALGKPLFAGVSGDVLSRMIADTRFGHIWLVRMALWLGLGGALWFARSDRWFAGVALVLGLQLLGTNSLFSHAASAADSLPAVAADYLHLAATALWVGGLIQFINVIGPVRRAFPKRSTALGDLVACFSNFARVSVVILIITGLYSAWLQVGSIEGLLTTAYGQALLVKLILILPLLSIAFVNLMYTYRGLRAGQDVWAGRLRNLVASEIALTLGVFAAVAVMTSISPARATLNARAMMTPPAPPDNLLVFDREVDDLNVRLEITPGWVGENTFMLTIFDENGQIVDDASRIRMRFTHLTQNLGESELRPENRGDGVYAVSGANLSVPGQWRIRTTIQRPGEFDSVIDFTPEMTSMPPIQMRPITDANAPLPNHVPVLLLTGVLALAAGGFFLAENRRSLTNGASVLGGGLALLALVFLFSGARALQTGKQQALAAPVSSDFRVAPDDPIRLAFSPVANLPYLITLDGTILQPAEAGVWNPIPLDARVNNIYVDTAGVIWAVTDFGLMSLRNGEWIQLDSAPVTHVEQSHGYIYALGNGEVVRAPLVENSPEHVRALDIPLGEQAASGFVMLGNHTHVLQNGGEVFVTGDLGLSWESLDAPAVVHAIWTDADGNLLAATDDGILSWDYASRTWSEALPLPEGQPVEMLRDLNGRLFALAAGQLYRLEGRAWTLVNLPEADYLTAIGVQYPGTLWALDGPGRTLWSTTDSETWSPTPIEVRDT